MDSMHNDNQLDAVHWIGLDVSKRSFEAALARDGWKYPSTRLCELPTRSFERSEKGVESFVRWANGLNKDEAEPSRMRVVMEATGRYSMELAEWLLARHSSFEPAIACPSHTAAFIKSLGLRNKTDKLEARALAFYGAERTPIAYEPPSAEYAELQSLSRYRDTLVRERTAARNRLAESGRASKFVDRMQAKRIGLLDADIKRIDAEMERLVEAAPKLKADIELFSSIHGVGFIVATVIVAELGDLRRFRKARQLTAFAGLSPRIYRSGTSVSGRPRMCKKGNPRVRQALYLSAMSTIRCSNDFQRTYQRLLDQGKPPMAAIGAVMRKLLIVMRALLITGKPYDPDRKLRGTTQPDFVEKTTISP